jgi:hypothetical protein
MQKVKRKKCALKGCGAEFTPNAYWQKYHTPKCAWTAHNKRTLALIRRGRKSIKEEKKKGVA